MKKSKHAPGPWLYRDKCGSIYTAPPKGSPHQFGEFIFRISDDSSISDENLRLVLAAPEMLKALQRVIRLADFDAARAAVATALGDAK